MRKLHEIKLTFQLYYQLFFQAVYLKLIDKFQMSMNYTLKFKIFARSQPISKLIKFKAFSLTDLSKMLCEKKYWINH